MSSSTQSSSSMSTSNSQQASCLDPLDSLIDFSEYETVSFKSEFKSPALSPSTSKSGYSRSLSSTPATLPSSQPTLSGPSHNYELYRQTTGIPPGSVANTLAVNQSMNQYAFTDNYLTGLSPSDEFIDFGTAPTQTPFRPDDMDFESPTHEPAFFFPEQSEFVDPSAIGGNNGLAVLNTPVVPTQSGNVGRLWPGMHQQQAAMAKAQAQQKQQQALIAQQRQQAMVKQQPRQQSQRPRASNTPTDPIVEEKISQLLNSMRQSSVTTEDGDDASQNMSQSARMRKDEEDMDEDERLLASEEGKKLSSKERRQLRNKVSARAFRSRRKEYISQLEGEIAAKVNENSDLRSQNRALMDENTRLSDLTRMLLSSPSFSNFLDTLSQNPAAQQQLPAPAPAPVERQVRKDVNPYAAQQQMQQHVGMTMIPEQTMDLSVFDLNTDGAFSYQPQVFSVLSMPETLLDAEALSGKGPVFTRLSSDDEKVELPTVERAPVAAEEATVEKVEVVDEEFDADPAFALFTAAPKAAAAAPAELDITSLLAGITIEKPSQYNLVVESEDDIATADAAMRKVDRICANLESMTQRLQSLTRDL